MASGQIAIRWHVERVVRERRNRISHGLPVRHPRCRACRGTGLTLNREADDCRACGGSGQIIHPGWPREPLGST